MWDEAHVARAGGGSPHEDLRDMTKTKAGMNAPPVEINTATRALAVTCQGFGCEATHAKSVASLLAQGCDPRPFERDVNSAPGSVLIQGAQGSGR